MSITIIEYNTEERLNYREKKYQQFLKYYLETDLRINEIFSVIGVNNRNSTARYIRRQLKKDGYNSYKRIGSIHKGEWVN